MKQLQNTLIKLIKSIIKRRLFLIAAERSRKDTPEYLKMIAERLHVETDLMTTDLQAKLWLNKQQNYIDLMKLIKSDELEKTKENIDRLRFV
jgi:hypothetical protein